MTDNIYIVRAIDNNTGNIKETRLTNHNNLKRCIYYTRHDNHNCEVHVNKASMCYDGYFVNGDYLPQYTNMEIDLSNLD